MTQPLPLSKRKPSSAMQAGLYYARKNRRARLDVQVANHITYSASPVNPDAESGTEGDGKND